MKAPTAAHPPCDAFEIVDDCIRVGGIPITVLAARVGRTPFYAYDRDAISRRIARLREALPRSLQLHYAMKANPMPAVVQHVAPLVDGFDVASAQEMKLALDAGVAPAEISFAGPGKTDAELRQSVAAGILVHVESDRELDVLADASRELGMPARIAVRVNPDFELKSSGMKMSGGPKQFGIDAERVPEVFARIASLGLAFEGLHIFSGSQNLSADALMEAQTKTVNLALRLAESAPAPIARLNIGGGLGIPYFPGERPLELERVGAHLGSLLESLAASLPSAAAVLELGRYIVGEAGLFVCRVIDRKVSRGQVFLVVDGGLHHHLAASGNFGQVIRKNYPVAIGNRVRGQAREVASVVGPLCTPLDLLADRMELAQAQIGDLVVVFQSGAYGLTASPTAFLSHPPALEVLV